MMDETQEKIEVWVLEWIERPQVIQAIRKLREEWQEAAGDDLLQVNGSVGLILYDVCHLLGLTDTETVEALGFTIE